MAKAWKIGEHRVEKNGTKTYTSRPSPTPHGVPAKLEKKKKQMYKCVDCEKRYSSRKRFKNEECYEVIEVDDD